MNSSCSSKIVLGKIAGVARNWINSSPKQKRRPLPSVFILLLCSCRRPGCRRAADRSPAKVIPTFCSVQATLKIQIDQQSNLFLLLSWPTFSLRGKWEDFVEYRQFVYPQDTRTCNAQSKKNQQKVQKKTVMLFPSRSYYSMRQYPKHVLNTLGLFNLKANWEFVKPDL